MRHAPPAGVSCSGAGLWRTLRVLLAALAAATFGAWLLLMFSQTPTPAAAAACAAAAGALGAVVAWRLTRSRPAVLHWDGERWSLDGETGAVAVMIDLGGWLLLRFAPAPAPAAGRARWLPVPQASHAVRVALHARPPRAAEH